MKQSNTYKNLSIAELSTKKKEFLKDLLTTRLTMDVTSLSSASNIQNLMRDLKIVNRLIAHKNAKSAQQEIG